jgi:hypothetical protein
VRSTVDYFIERGNIVYAADLDIRKAHDTVHHIKQFSALLKVGLPQLFVAVHRLGSLSVSFQVRSVK